MSFCALGVSHKTAELAIREQLAIGPDEMPRALAEASLQIGHHNVVILSTCNRTEIYAMGATLDKLRAWLVAQAGIPISDLQPHLYQFEQLDALKHLVEVTCGLDSMLLGEPQILGQFRRAVATAQEHLTLDKRFSWLIDQVLRVTKAVRTQCALGAHTLTLGVATQKLSEQIFSDPQQLSVLMVGAGETNQLIAKHLTSRPLKQLYVANRSVERAQQLLDGLDGGSYAARAFGLSELEEQLSQCDLLISCTNSSSALIRRDSLERAMKRRKYKPMLVIDLAVPRDIDPTVGQIEQVYHYAIDDLQQVLEQNQRKREQAASAASQMIQAESKALWRELEVQDFAPVIAQLKDQLTQVQSELLEQHTANLTSEESARLQAYGHALSAKLSHPSFRLARQIAQIEDPKLKQELTEALIEAFKGR